MTDDPRLAKVLTLSDTITDGRADWRDYITRLYRRAVAQVGHERAEVYARARLTLADTARADLGDLHRAIFGDLHDAPAAWRSAVIDRDHNAWAARVDSEPRNRADHTRRERNARSNARRRAPH